MSPNTQAANFYSLTDLGTLPGFASSSASHINANGQVVGTSFNDSAPEGPPTDAHVFVWGAASGMVDIGLLPSHVTSYPSGINAGGQVVGNSYTGSYIGQPYSWSAGGGLSELSTLLGSGSVVHDINDSGQIVATNYGSGQGFVWSPSGGLTNLTPLPGDTSTSAAAINASGQVVGVSANNASQISQLYLWDASTGMTGLGSFGYQIIMPRDINASGQILVSGYNVNGVNVTDYRSFVWDANSGVTLLGELPGFASTEALGMNASGQVVGFGLNYNANNGVSDFRGFLWSASEGIIDLNSLIVNNIAGWSVNGLDINDAGQIVGEGTFDGGVTYHAILLNPTTVPVPPAVWLFGSALAGLIGVSRRRKSPDV